MKILLILLALALIGCATRQRQAIHPQTVTWRISRYGSGMAEGDQRREILRAMRTWEGLIPVRFEETNGAATLDISFVTEGLGESTLGETDGYAPDYYRNMTVRFNELAATFTDGSSNVDGRVVNLYDVALHELGHVVGLRDNDDFGSVMFFKYPRGTNDLGEGDRRRLEEIYGRQPN